MSANHFKIRDYVKPKRALNGTKIDAYSADLRDVWLKEIQGRFPNATEEDIFGEHKIYENGNSVRLGGIYSREWGLSEILAGEFKDHTFYPKSLWILSKDLKE